jgi:hypothetical protein
LYSTYLPPCWTVRQARALALSVSGITVPAAATASPATGTVMPFSCASSLGLMPPLASSAVIRAARNDCSACRNSW